MFGLMLPVFIGFAALAVDTSMIAVARSQLSTAADSAALAGAQQLATENRVRGAPRSRTEITAANNQALAFAQKNTVLGATPSCRPTSPTPVTARSSSATSTRRIQLHARLVVGLDQSFNSVQVTSDRDANHGGPVPTSSPSSWGSTGRTSP